MFYTYLILLQFEMASKQCSNEWENLEFDEDEGVVSYLTPITMAT